MKPLGKMAYQWMLLVRHMRENSGMTAQISTHGRLVADPQKRTTANNKHMTMARLTVSLPCNSAQNGEATYWLGVVAFGKQAELLAQHHKGDLIRVAGNMQLNQWKAQDGTQQEAPQVIAYSVISARTVHAGAQKTAGTAQDQTPTPQSTQPSHATRRAGLGWRFIKTSSTDARRLMMNRDFKAIGVASDTRR